MVHCEEDSLCLTSAADEVAAASSSVELARIKGGAFAPCTRRINTHCGHVAGHFDIYPGGSHYAEDLKIQKEFLQRVAPV